MPKEELKCPDGVGVIMKEYTCNGNGVIGNIVLVNSGRFSVAGVYIRGGTEDDDLAVYNILGNDGEGNQYPYWPKTAEDNKIEPGKSFLEYGFERNLAFASAPEWPAGKALKILEIVPFRIDEFEGRNRFVICTEAKIVESVQGCTIS